jgi:ATP-binding cassette, subfamily C (CFTR/MRP), member 1
MLAIFSLLQIANVVVWSLESTFQTPASLAAASLSLAAALTLSTLSYIEHTRCIRPSSVINAYLLMTVPMDAAKVRTLWLRGGSLFVAGFASTVLVIKLLVLVVEATEKRRILLSPYSDYSPEATSGLYARGLFWWLNPIFLLGYKSILRDVDLFPTDDSLASESLRKRFQSQWSKRDTIPSPFHLRLITNASHR